MERRQSPRFGLAVPMDAHVSVLQQVEIEQAGENDITLVSGTPGIRGEEVTLRIGPSDAVQMTIVVRTIQSEPCMRDGRLMHRIRLAMAGPIALSNGTEAAQNTWRSGDRTATVIIRRHPARVLNLSRGGCLFELPTRLPIGTVATLQRSSGPVNPEAVRVNFLHERHGVSWNYHAGVEFLSLSAPSTHSLRSLAGQMEAEERRGPLAGRGQESIFSLTNSVSGPVDILSIVCAEMGSHAPARASMGPFKPQSKSGKPLALVGGQNDSPEHS